MSVLAFTYLTVLNLRSAEAHRALARYDLPELVGPVMSRFLRWSIHSHVASKVAG